MIGYSWQRVSSATVMTSNIRNKGQLLRRIASLCYSTNLQFTFSELKIKKQNFFDFFQVQWEFWWKCFCANFRCFIFQNNPLCGQTRSIAFNRVHHNKIYWRSSIVSKTEKVFFQLNKICGKMGLVKDFLFFAIFGEIWIKKVDFTKYIENIYFYIKFVNLWSKSNYPVFVY